MAATFSTDPSSTLERGDIRSESLPFKRNRDHAEKWSRGGRPIDVHLNFVDVTDPRSQPGKLRPQKRLPVFKERHTMAPSTDWGYEAHVRGALRRKADGVNDPTLPSGSVLSLPPQHHNNTAPAVRTSAVDGVLYNFDNSGPSPFQKSSSVALDGLVEKAEEQWISKQTEQMVRGEYEVLDGQGEVVKGRKKGSPRQNAVHDKAKVVLDDDKDDDFELV